MHGDREHARRIRRNRRAGVENERTLVRALNAAGVVARRNPGSGAAPGAKGDVVISLEPLGAVLVEAKRLTPRRRAAGSQRYVTLDLTWLDKIAGQADAAGAECSVVCIRVKGDSTFFVLMDLDVFLRCCGGLTHDRNGDKDKSGLA